MNRLIEMHGQQRDRQVLQHAIVDQARAQKRCFRLDICGQNRFVAAITIRRQFQYARHVLTIADAPPARKRQSVA